MYFNSEGASEAASTSSLCDAQCCKAAGDAHFRPLREAGRSFAAGASNAEIGRTHCFFESIFLKSLPVTPAREVYDCFQFESCALSPTPPQADKAVVKIVKKPWCFVFCCSCPAQLLRPQKARLVPLSPDYSDHLCIRCQTDTMDGSICRTQKLLQRKQWKSTSTSCSRPVPYCLQPPIPQVEEDPLTFYAAEAEEDFMFKLELLHQQQQDWKWQICVEARNTTNLQSTGSRREKMLFYCDQSYFDETVEHLQIAEIYKRLYHPLTARCTREPATALSDSRMEQWRVQCTEPKCASFTETLRLASRYSSESSTCDCCCTTDRQQLQMERQWHPVQVQSSSERYASYQSHYSDCGSSVSYKNLQPAPGQQRDKRWRRQRRQNPADSPSDSAVSSKRSAETESTVLQSAIAKGGLHHLLQTLERARLRYSVSAVPTALSSPATGSRRHGLRQQSEVYRFQTCPATCNLYSPEADGENEEIEKLEDEYVEESEPENRCDGNQSNVGDNCRDQSYVCGSPYCNCNMENCCEDDPPCDGCLAEPSAQPPPDGSSVSQPERRDAELIDSVSQSLLTLTKSMESCMRRIRGTVAELQRCCDSDSMQYT